MLAIKPIIKGKITVHFFFLNAYINLNNVKVTSSMDKIQGEIASLGTADGKNI
jgi:hypothetical protein